jgi:hypothetical protein
MGARFAGSQRLGDRRRRRLAVETDDVSGNAGRGSGLSAPPGITRTLDHADADHSSIHPIPSAELAIAGVIPPQWWKYLIGGLGCLATSGGLVMAGCYASETCSALGPGMERLFAFPDAPVVRWFSSLLLSVSAQLAVFIWWTRSQSQKDFEGRYWLWIRVAFAWLIFGGCVATSANAACSATLLHFWPELSVRTATLGWLIPTSVAGIATLLSLAREMRGCGWSYALLRLAAGSYLIAAGLHLELEALVSPARRELLLNAALLGGHTGLFMSMWLHARHVKYCTSDPATPPNSGWRIPRPHFRLLGLRRNRSLKPEAQPADAPLARRKRPARSSTPESESASDPAPDNIPAVERTEVSGKPNFPIDGPHKSASVEADETTLGAISGGPRPWEFAPATFTETNTDSEMDRPRERNEPEESDVESEQSPSTPDLRGLSKKQRRRLMQEIRERERAAGR